MPRPFLDVGRHGDIGYRRHPLGGRVADAYVRDQDGTRRRVRANGNSKTAAKNALDAKLERRPTFTGSPITGTMTVTELATRWLAQHAERITPQTRDKYPRLLKNQIKPGIGNLR
jgi:hypothetical protein